MAAEELDALALSERVAMSRVMDAIDNAADQDKITWLTENGKRIAAVVPVEVAEAYEQGLADVLSTPAGTRPHYVSLGVTDDEVARGDDFGKYDFPNLRGGDS